MQIKACQTCSIFAYRMTTFKISIQDGTKLLLRTREIPQKNALEILYKMKLQGSEQIQRVLGMYNQKLNRDQVSPNYQRLRTMVRQHIDLMISTRNFKAQNERIETGVLVKSF